MECEHAGHEQIVCDVVVCGLCYEAEMAVTRYPAPPDGDIVLVYDAFKHREVIKKVRQSDGEV